MTALIIAVIAVITLFAFCILSTTDISEEEQMREDEEQMEYLRKWREKHNE